jgi:Tol biopolymer transport system component
MSPEQARGESLTPASDIYSFGLVLYELATGTHPFPAGSPLDTAQAILTKQPRPPSSVNSSIPAHLDSLIRAMLAKEPAARPSAEQIARALEKPPTSLGTFRHWQWTTAVAALVAACLSVWWWQQARNRPSFRQITTLVPENRATAAAISPDGKLAAYANVDGIFLRSMQNGNTKALSTPADYVVDRLAWFADNRRLVASGFSAATYIPSIWLISANGASPRLLRTDARLASPSPDGRHVVFISADQSEIWVTDADGNEARRIVAASPDRINFVLWAQDGRRLMFHRFHHSNRDSVLSYESVALATGRTLATVRHSWMSSASALSDGRIVYLRWDNDDFTSARAIWEVKTNSATGAFLGQPRKVADIVANDTTLLDLIVSADGKQSMVLRRSDQNTIFLGDFDQSSPRITNIRRFTLDERINYPHAWTADSRAVIFESDRNGNFDLFRQNIGRRTPETLVDTPYTEILPQLSPDGRFVLYAARPLEPERPWYYKPRTYKLMRVPVNGGTPAEVPIGGMLEEFRCALGPGKRCVLRTTLPEGYRVYYDLDAVNGKGRELARTKSSLEFLGDWDISPDGTHIAIPNHDPREARIRVVALEPGPGEVHEREMVLSGLANLRGLVWAADGSGWFVSVDTSVGNRLLYVYLDGRYRSLGDIQGWAVPSPDGKRVAFLDRTIATNAWLFERR